MKKRRIMMFISGAAVLAVLLAGCGSPDTEAETGAAAESQTATKSIDETENVISEEQAFYDYLQNTVIPEKGLASMEVCTVENGSKGAGLSEAGALGLLSAYVRDFDNDGQKEMAALFLDTVPMKNTSLGRFSLYSGAGEEEAVVLKLCLYTKGSDGISLSDSVDGLAIMEKISWGPMIAGYQTVDGMPYIYGYSRMTDEMTYGPSPFMVYHVENGKFVYDFIGGRIGWGQGSESGDLNEIAGAAGMSIVKTPLNDIFNAVQKLNGNYEEDIAQAEDIGGIVMGYVSIASSQPGMVTCQAQDDTYLREALENGCETVMDKLTAEAEAADKAAEEAAQAALEQAEADSPQAKAEAIAEEISAAMGISMELINEKEDNGFYSARYQLPEYSVLYIQLSSETGQLLTLAAYAEGGTVTEEWLNLKDTVLKSASANLNQDAVAQLFGDCGFGYGDGLDVGDDIRVIVGNAGTCTMMIQWPR